MADRPPAQRDEIVDIERADAALAQRAGALEGGVRRSREDGIEIPQLAGGTLAAFLRIDLLETEDIGVQARQLGLQGRAPGIDREGAAAAPAEILDIEGRQPNTHRAAPAFPGLDLGKGRLAILW